jgi:uncharacterized protein
MMGELRNRDTSRGPAPHFPSSAPIDAYGNGGFRFADMSHRGSLLCLPSGIWPWPVTKPDEIDEASLQLVVAAAAEVDLLIIGTGRAPWTAPEALRWRLRDLRIGMDVMPTSAAVRTYNILQGERRRVAAALIAVE